MNDATEIRLELAVGEGDDPGQLEQDAASLLEELRELETGEVRPAPREDAPPGTRSAELAIDGILLLCLARDMIPALIRTIESWVSRRPDRVVKIAVGDDSVELSAASPEQQEELVVAFLAARRAQ